MAVETDGRLLAGRYRTVRRLGFGGMATVVLAKDERLDRAVAVKRMHADSTGESARRFEREAKVGASLNHPSIVAVYDTFVEDESVFIVMEYVDGATLADEVTTGPLEAQRAVAVVSDIAAA